MAKMTTDGGYATEATQKAILDAVGPGPTAEPAKFIKDGVVTEVEEGSGGQNPLPVKLTSAGGDINITANDLNVALDSANDSVEVLQDTRADLNANATIQIEGADVNAGNPVPVTLPGDKADLDLSAGTDNHEIFAIGLPGATGHVVGGTISDPLRIDPTGTTSQPVSQTTHDSLNLNANLQVGDSDVTNINPVPISDAGGTITIDGSISNTSFDATQATHDSLNANANLQVGDADVTNLNPVPISDAGGTITIDGSIANTSFDATQATHDSLNANANLQVGDADVTNLNPVPISDAGGTLTIDGSISNTSFDATQATHDSLNANANLQVGDADVTNLNPVPISDAGGTITIDGSISNTSFDATQATHDSLNANVNLQVGDADVTNLNPVPISDAGGTITIDGSISNTSFDATQTTHDSLNANANLQVGDADVTVTNPVPIKIGTGESIPVTSGKMDVLDFIDNAQGPVLDASVTNIPSLAAGNAQIVVSSLAANVKAVYVADTTGQFIGVYNKLTPASVDDGLEFIINPGMDRLIEVDLSGSAGSGIYLRNMVTGVINSGQLMMQFLG